MLNVYLIGLALTTACLFIVMPEIRLAASLDKEKTLEEHPAVAALAFLLLIIFWPITWVLLACHEEK